MEMFDINESRSYATVENLEKALDKMGFAKDRKLIVWNKAGRVTAVFPFSNIQDGNAMRYASQGFMTLG